MKYLEIRNYNLLCYWGFSTEISPLSSVCFWNYLWTWIYWTFTLNSYSNVKSNTCLEISVLELFQNQLLISVNFAAVQCDESCSQYKPCVKTCPLETCDNTLVYKSLSTLCNQDTCVEGIVIEYNLITKI